MLEAIIVLVIAAFAVVIFRYWKRHDDRVVNFLADPFLDFAEQQRKQGAQMFAPWFSRDQALLSRVQELFPHVPLPDVEHLREPDTTPVRIEPMRDEHVRLLQDRQDYVVAVGGPPAAMMAFAQAKQGRRVIYVCHDREHSRPIWMGAANHIEPHVLTQAPAFISGLHPWRFLWQECLRFLNPPRFDRQVLRDNYPWLTLNAADWLRHPLQIPAGLRVAWGNYQLAHRRAKANGSSRYDMLCARTQRSAEYMTDLHEQYGHLLRAPRGSLIIAPDQETWWLLQEDMKCQKEGVLREITPEEAGAKYGFTPRHAAGLMEKTHDFILEPDFYPVLTAAIQSSGGIMPGNWRLTRILTAGQGGMLEFYEQTETGERKYHYRKFSQAFLSLGSTLYEPWLYDLISVTGVSINALVMNVKMSGGPVVCGGKGNHVAVTPLAAPEQINGQDCSFVRIAAGGCIGPLIRDGGRWYTYPGETAVNALHCLRECLPENAQIRVLSVTGCNRVTGRDGRQVDLHPQADITIQIGAAGGGLTQMAALCGEVWS